MDVDWRLKVFCPAFLQKSGRGPGAEPWPRAAARGTLLVLMKRRRGSKGEPSPGVPPLRAASAARSPAHLHNAGDKRTPGGDGTPPLRGLEERRRWHQPLCAAFRVQKGPRRKSRSFWWGRVDSNHRRHCQQIYSLSPLATREHPRIRFSQRGAGGRTRTPDLLITNQLLYRLSYTSAIPATTIIANSAHFVNKKLVFSPDFLFRPQCRPCPSISRRRECPLSPSAAAQAPRPPQSSCTAGSARDG